MQIIVKMVVLKVVTVFMCHHTYTYIINGGYIVAEHFVPWTFRRTDNSLPSTQFHPLTLGLEFLPRISNIESLIYNIITQVSLTNMVNRYK